MNETQWETSELHRRAIKSLHLFAGAGGGILGDILLGHTPICAVEFEKYRRKVLRQRQKDKILPFFPIFKDVRTFNGNPWKGIVDLICGGFPCQDVSSAGKGMGVKSGKRSGLWREYARIVSEVQPSFVFIENSPLLVTRGLDIVLSDLAQMGYNARWICLGAGDIGALHERERIWILAYPDSKFKRNEDREISRQEWGSSSTYESKVIRQENKTARSDRVEASCINTRKEKISDSSKKEIPRLSMRKESKISESGINSKNRGGVTSDQSETEISHSEKERCEKHDSSSESRKLEFPCRISNKGVKSKKREIAYSEQTEWIEGRKSIRTLSELLAESWTSRIWETESELGRVVDGVPDHVDRLEAIGDAQVPQVVFTAFKILSEGLI